MGTKLCISKVVDGTQNVVWSSMRYAAKHVHRAQLLMHYCDRPSMQTVFEWTEEVKRSHRVFYYNG